MSRILITGSSGQVGFELQRSLAGLAELIAVDVERMNLTDPIAIRRVMREIAPDLIINTAAYTAVDLAESQPELAMAVNGIAPGIIAEEARRLGATLIHYSTDYVFDGTKAGPYTEEDEPRPMSVYGRTKLAGDQAIEAVDVPYLILRTSWVYGARGKNFLLTILRLARERDELKIVDDQIGAPTWSRAIARATADILKRLGYGQPGFHAACAERRGVYNFTAAGQISWHGFAAAILENAKNLRPIDVALALERVPALKAIPSERYPTPAQRPRNSVLAHDKLERVFGVALADWRASLDECMRNGGTMPEAH